MLDEGEGCFVAEGVEPLPSFIAAIEALQEVLRPFIATLPAGVLEELEGAIEVFSVDVAKFRGAVAREQAGWRDQKTGNGDLVEAVARLAPIAECSRSLIKQADLLMKLAGRLIETCESECNAREINRTRKAADECRHLAVRQLKEVRYFWRQAHWLTERFPDAKLTDVAGLVKLVDRAEIEANDWSLTPGRYVGVAPEEVEEDFDFEEVLREIHTELEDLNAEAVRLAATIKRNFEELGV